MESLRPSEAEIVFWPKFEWAWPFGAENGRNNFGTPSNYFCYVKIDILRNFQHSKDICSKMVTRYSTNTLDAEGRE